MDQMLEQRARGVTYAALRILTGLLFAQHGAQKLFGWLGGTQVETIFSQMGLAGVLELFGGVLIALGLLTRPVAFVLAGEMAVAYFMMHAPQSFWPVLNQGELAVLFCFSFLFFAAHGAGRFSLDALLGRRRGEAAPLARAERRRRDAAVDRPTAPPP